MFNLIDPATIKTLLSEHHLAPNRFLGQNFLIDQNVLDKIIEIANLKAGDNVLEIGPGLGTLTAALGAAGANVVAIEKDQELIPALEENLQELANSCGERSRTIKIINDDFLQVEFDSINSVFKDMPQAVIASESDSPAGEEDERGNPADGAINTGLLRRGVYTERSERAPRNDRKNGGFQYKIISNIPYYITSPVIRKIFSFSILPTEIVFLVQREVAERIAAPAGEMSLISLFAQYHGAPRVEGIVKPESFWPAPKVESAILKIIVGKRFKLPPEQEKELWRLAKIGFSSRRKTLANNLAAGFRRKNSEMKELLKKAGFNENARAQELGVEEWIELLKAMNKMH